MEWDREESRRVAGHGLLTGAFSCLLLAALTVVAGCLWGGCATAPGADPLLVQAERTADMAFQTFDTFLRFEHDNQAALRRIDPAIHETAELIRREGPGWLTSLREATRAYKRERTADTEAGLKSALVMIQAALAQAQKHLERKAP